MNDFQKKAIEYIDENAGIFTGVSDAVWSRPELSLKEFESAALYCSVLREHGFEVTEGLCGIKTAFCGISFNPLAHEFAVFRREDNVTAFKVFLGLFGITCAD